MVVCFADGVGVLGRWLWGAKQMLVEWWGCYAGGGVQLVYYTSSKMQFPLFPPEGGRSDRRPYHHI